VVKNAAAINEGNECPAFCELPNEETVSDLVITLRQASPEFAALFNRYGEAAPTLRHFGLILWEQNRLEISADLFRAALTIEPQNADLWRDFGSICERLSETASSEYCLRQSLYLKADDARTWLMLAHLCNGTGRTDEAQIAFERATAVDASCGDAHFGLGLLNFTNMKIDAAIINFRGAVETGYANAMGYSALGHALYLAGDFKACAEAFDMARTFGALDDSSRRKHARAHVFIMMLDGEIEKALNTYPLLAGDAAEPVADIIRDAFAQFSAYDYPEAAIAVGQYRLAQNPGDPTQRYLLDAVSGRDLSRAPADYLEDYFDRFAPTFEHKLVDVLHYDAPAQMAELVGKERQAFGAMLDLGCGTGLAAPHLAPLGGVLTGVDLSGGMLEKARIRGLYTSLMKTDAITFLNGSLETYDLIFAADVLVYLGDLASLFAAVARVLRTDGLFAVSIETVQGQDYCLLPSGRFAHSPSYLEHLAASSFACVTKQAAMIRLEAGRPAQGMFLIFKRL